MAVPGLVFLIEPLPLITPSSSKVSLTGTSKLGVEPLARTTLLGNTTLATDIAKFGLFETLIGWEPAEPALLKLIRPPDRFTPPGTVLAAESVAVPALT